MNLALHPVVAFSLAISFCCAPVACSHWSPYRAPNIFFFRFRAFLPFTSSLHPLVISFVMASAALGTPFLSISPLKKPSLRSQKKQIF